MLQVWITRRGDVDVLEVREAPDPRPALGETLVAVWSAVNPEDDYVGKRVTLKITGMQARTADAVDTFHALVQKLDPRIEGDSLTIDGLLVMDYPIIVRFR